MTLLRKIASQLPGETADSDAHMLLSEITGYNRAWLLSHPEFKLSAGQEQILNEDIRKLTAGVPLPYVLGHWEFFGVDFLVSPDVLIPRPETELLVETALAFIRKNPKDEYKLLDVGTGSGIIPISLALNITKATFFATDISPSALQIAKSNAEKYGLTDRIRFIEADLIPDDLGYKKYDVISANLPYIPTETLLNLEVFGKEPTLALDGGQDGLGLIEKILIKITSLSLHWRLILLEIEQRQGVAVRELAHEYFPQASVRILRDLSGFDRLIAIQL